MLNNRLLLIQLLIIIACNVWMGKFKFGCLYFISSSGYMYAGYGFGVRGYTVGIRISLPLHIPYAVLLTAVMSIQV